MQMYDEVLPQVVSPTIRAIESRRMSCAGHVACIGR